MSQQIQGGRWGGGGGGGDGWSNRRHGGGGRPDQHRGGAGGRDESWRQPQPHGGGGRGGRGGNLGDSSSGGGGGGGDGWDRNRTAAERRRRDGDGWSFPCRGGHSDRTGGGRESSRDAASSGVARWTPPAPVGGAVRQPIVAERTASAAAPAAAPVRPTGGGGGKDPDSSARVKTEEGDSSARGRAHAHARADDAAAAAADPTIDREAKRQKTPRSSIRQENWDQFSWEDRVLSQFPDNDDAPTLGSLQAFFPVDCLKEDSEEWLARKTAAAKHAYQATLAAMEKAAPSNDDEDGRCDDDDDDSEFEYDDAYADLVPESRQRLAYDPDFIRRYTSALVRCLLFDAGFAVLGVDPRDEVNCHCPCGPKMKAWRRQFGLEGVAEGGDECTRNKKMEPAALLDHLEKVGVEGQNFLHFAAEKYLRFLYKDHNNGFGHKALFKKGTNEFKQAEAAERRMNIKARKKLEEQLEAERRLRKEYEEKDKRRKEEMEVLKKINKETYEKLEQLRKDKEALGIKIDREREKQKVTTEVVESYRKQFRAFIDSLRIGVLATRTNPTKVNLKVDQSFSLQELFTEWSTEDEDETYLFRTLDSLDSKKIRGYHNWRLFQDWNVQYECLTGKKRNDENRAIDEGGPTREFLSQVFQQMGDLAILIEVGEAKNEPGTLWIGTKVIYDGSIGTISKVRKKRDKMRYDVCFGGDAVERKVHPRMLEAQCVPLKLFERDSSGYQPVSDQMLEFQLGAIEKGYVLTTTWHDVRQKAARIYEAIGRIMLHCIITDHPISSTALPNFFCNVIFRDCLPGQSGYQDSDVLDHLFEIGFKGNVEKEYLGSTFDLLFCDGDERVITKELFFKDVIPKIFIEERKMALDALKKGLTLSGTVHIPAFFQAVPLQVVRQLAFSNPSISADDVIAVLEAKYCDEDINGEELEEILKEGQRRFFNVTLKKVIRDRDRRDRTDEDQYKMMLEDGTNFTSKFVSFCTGLSHLPHREGNPGYKIIVEFDFAESTKESLPVAHTCEKIFKVPGWAYDNDIDDFQDALDRTLIHTLGTFGMN